LIPLERTRDDVRNREKKRGYREDRGKIEFNLGVEFQGFSISKSMSLNRRRERDNTTHSHHFVLLASYPVLQRPPFATSSTTSKLFKFKSPI
jgi:hypothetical protein